MPENSTGKSSSNGDHRNGPPWLRRRVTRGLPSPLVSACLASAALGLAACAGPASTQALPASAGTVSARSAAPTTAPAAPSASATDSTATAAATTQPTPGAAPSRTQPGSANPALPLAPSQLPAFSVEAWTAQKGRPS